MSFRGSILNNTARRLPVKGKLLKSKYQGSSKTQRVYALKFNKIYTTQINSKLNRYGTSYRGVSIKSSTPLKGGTLMCPHAHQYSRRKETKWD